MKKAFKYIITTILFIGFLSFVYFASIGASTVAEKYDYTSTHLVNGTQELSHEHSLTPEVHPATCTEAGYTLYTCSECTYTKKVTTSQPLGHSYYSVVNREATCTISGYSTQTCRRCGDSYTETLPASHNWIYTIVKEATCTEDGIISEKKCSKCGAIEAASVIPAKGHSLYETEEKRSYHSLAITKCRNCDYEKVEYLKVNLENLYGYQHLRDDYGKGKLYAELYKQMFDACYEYLLYEGEYSFYYNDDGMPNVLVTRDSTLSFAEKKAIYYVFKEENPQFYFGYTFTFNDPGNLFAIVVHGDYDTYAEKKEVNEAVSQELTKVRTLDLHSIYRHITEITEYNHYNVDNKIYSNSDHNIVGPIMKGITVCEGYGKLLLLDCYAAGYHCIPVLGAVLKTTGAWFWKKTYTDAYHYWNMLEWNGKWYGLDVTWDDAGNYSYDSYYLCNSSTLYEQHVPGTSDFSAYEEYQDYEGKDYRCMFNVAVPSMA